MERQSHIAPKVVELRPGSRIRKDEAALLEGLVQGQPGAREEFYDRYAERVQRVVSRILGDDPDLPDVMQDVFIKAFEKAGTVREAARVQAWITQIAVHATYGLLRRRKRRSWLRHVPIDRVEERPCSPPDYEGRQLLEDVFAILDTMPPEERIPFTLRFFDQMELVEVAKACDISLATVKRRLRSAKETFMKYAMKNSRLAERAKKMIDGSE